MTAGLRGTGTSPNRPVVAIVETRRCSKKTSVHSMTRRTPFQMLDLARCILAITTTVFSAGSIRHHPLAFGQGRLGASLPQSIISDAPIPVLRL
jgi:hypothetical protein